MLLKLIDPEISGTKFKCVPKAFYVQKPSYRVIMIVKIFKQLKYFQIGAGWNCGRFLNGIYEDI